MAKEEDELTLTVIDPLVEGGDCSDLDIDLDAIDTMSIDTNGVTFTVTPDFECSTDDFAINIDTDDGIDYKFDEDIYINELLEYVSATYDQHYAKDKFQATEFIIDGGHGTGFNIGNVLKYAQRYGKKGTAEDARKDLMKVLHYALIQLYVHDNDL